MMKYKTPKNSKKTDFGVLINNVIMEEQSSNVISNILDVPVTQDGSLSPSLEPLQNIDLKLLDTSKLQTPDILSPTRIKSS